MQVSYFLPALVKGLQGLAWLGVASTALAAWEPVEGLIEGKLSWSGKPVVDAQITSCVDRRWLFSAHGPCAIAIETRTDTYGRFSFRQTTGFSPPTPDEVRKSPNLVIGDPGWSYGFRVDFDGMAALFFDQGMGYGRTHVRLECDFGAFLDAMKKAGIRPVANPGNMPFIECDRSETLLKLRVD